MCVFSLPRFGGGPAVNHLYMCAICQVEIEALAKRRKMEIDTFIKVRIYFYIIKDLSVDLLYRGFSTYIATELDVHILYISTYITYLR